MHPSQSQTAQKLIEPLISAPVVGKESLDIADGVRVGSPHRKEAMLDTILAVDWCELGRHLTMRTFDAIELTLLS